MAKQIWYVLAYDIRDQKRLSRLHYHLKKHALALQKSVFLVEEKNYQAAWDVVEKYSKQNEDDVRLYPIVHPNALWGAGLQVDALAGLGIAEVKSKPLQKNPNGIIKKTMKWLSRSH